MVLALPSTSPAPSSMRPMNISIGTPPAGSVLTSTVRVIIPPPWIRRRSTCPPMSGVTGSKASPRRAISSRPMARSWKRPVRCATAAPSRSAWARSPAGTPSWTKTATWSAAGTSSSLLSTPRQTRSVALAADLDSNRASKLSVILGLDPRI
ncbi:hypothetical protein AGR8A_Lc50066 [Agrobacterium fabrum str. J-07]|nr:hypothetical protein AGR8A_Lc50066 [Agrobacterium fabrum str. J-07]